MDRNDLKGGDKGKYRLRVGYELKGNLKRRMEWLINKKSDKHTHSSDLKN